jgi:phytoene dehydrogenase-like protein
MNEKSTIIIGAGIAGLSTGCYGQMNGYRTQIFEMHDELGGCCTSWKRDGYTIDGCFHYLTGSGPGQVFYPIWQELGALHGRTIVDPDEYASIEGEDGKVFIVYSDADRLEQHMKELAPEDKDVIEEFTGAIRKMIHFPMPVEKPPELYNPIDGLKMMYRMLPFLNFYRKFGRVTIQDYAQRFKNPFLRQAFLYIVNLQNTPDFPLLGQLQVLAWMDQKTAGFPVGGSLEFASAIGRRYLGLGGEIHFESRVDKILVENARAVGVRLTDGSEHRSDYVISAADGHRAIFDLLEGKYINDKIRGYYKGLPVTPPILHIGLGVARSFEELPHSATGTDFPLDMPVTVGGKKHERMCVRIYNFDPTLAPAGKTVMKVYFASEYANWKELKQDPVRYEAEKEHIADQAVAALDKRFPGIAAQVEMRDVATPTTFEHYTGNWQGAFMGWETSTETLIMRMSKTLPGLENFYMAGMWVEPGGGVPTAAMSGRNVTQMICRKDKRPFITAVP